jgi:D-alanyl-D-alanine dipeptidase
MIPLSGLLISFITLFSCKTDVPSQPKQIHVTPQEETAIVYEVDHDTTRWKELTDRDGYFIDIKYATTDNFVGEVIYPCGKCYLVPAAARALQNVKFELYKKGYGLKLFDCYRPRPAQYKLWEKVPNPNYVARPSEGSMHNRGVAIDLTITDQQGREIDMGTPYDFFGPEAHHDYKGHDKKVNDMRTLLKSTMEKHGFASIRTEWWHYSLASGKYPLEDWEWKCN